MHIYYPHTSTFSRVSEIWCAFSVKFFKQAGGWPSTEGHFCSFIRWRWFLHHINIILSLCCFTCMQCSRPWNIFNDFSETYWHQFFFFNYYSFFSSFRFFFMRIYPFFYTVFFFYSFFSSSCFFFYVNLSFFLISYSYLLLFSYSLYTSFCLFLCAFTHLFKISQTQHSSFLIS